MHARQIAATQTKRVTAPVFVGGQYELRQRAEVARAVHRRNAGAQRISDRRVVRLVFHTDAVREHIFWPLFAEFWLGRVHFDVCPAFASNETTTFKQRNSVG